MSEPTISSRAYVQSTPFYRLSTFVTTSFPLVFSSEETRSKVSTSPLHGTARGASVEFYDKFQRKADEYDRDFVEKYERGLDTFVIFVSVLFRIHLDRRIDLFSWANRPVCYPRSHPRSSLIFRADSDRITKK
jgi:hypothetical protein